MKLEDVPDLKGSRYPKRISVAVSEQVFQKLDQLKKNKRKDPSELVRMLIDEFLKENQVEEAG